MFQNLTRAVNSATDTFTKLLNIVDINATSIEKLSLAGNERADLVLQAAKYDCKEQSVKLKAKLAAAQKEADAEA